MDKKLLAALIYKKCYLTGDFTLRSGQKSNEYFDKYQFESDPQLLYSICLNLLPLIPQNTDILAGLEVGGIPIATMLSHLTGLPLVLVRKKAKEYGTCLIAEGPNPQNKKVCVIEDVVTSGGQIILSTQDLRNIGATVTHVLCVIVRSEEGVQKLSQNKIELKALFTSQEIKDAKDKV